MQNNILVLYDFTEIADYALHHAIRLGKNMGRQVTLLHIIHAPQLAIEKRDEHKQTQYEQEIKNKLHEVVKKLHEEHQIKINYLVKHGNIFTDIGVFEKEVEAILIIMGTHGSKGIQQFIGSNVVRVISGSNIPFIVVQKSMPENGYRKIIIPVDFSTEITSLQKWLILLAKKYQSTVYLFNNTRPNHAVQELIQQNVENIAKELQNENINYTIKQAITGKETFAGQTIEYSNGVGANLIMIISNQAKGLSDFFLIQYMQKIIMNPFSVPVMCVNPENSFNSF